MPASIRLACRRGTPVLLGLTVSCSLLVSTGCATHNRPSAAGEPDYEASISAREYGYVRPAADVWVLGEDLGQPRREKGVASLGGGPDLWDRVRAGMKLEHYADPRIDAKADSFRRDPQYLTKLSQRARPYLHVVIGEIERRGLPAELALLPHVESRYNPAATSPKAAAGMWQFIPSTGRIMGLRQDHWHDDRRDLLASTRAAMDYLQQLNRRFGGDWELAMAAYNCGPGRVESAQVANRSRGKPTDFWSLDLPSETENYVPQILAAARLVAQPAKYGLRLPAVPSSPQLELVRTQGPLDLARVAQVSGVGVAELQRLNPGLKQGRTAPDGPGRLLVPAGHGKRITARLASAQVLPAVPPAAALSSTEAHKPAGRRVPAARLPVAGEGQAYLVKAGDSLGSIARAQGLEPQTLADLNGMLVREPLLPGQTLRIPGGSASPFTAHRVQKGDSLDTIARRYGVSVGEIKRWNQLGTKEVRAGEVIRIYRRAG